MYELTKKRRVSDAVAEVFPEEVSKAIFDVINVMNKAGQIVTSPVAIAFQMTQRMTKSMRWSFRANSHQHKNSPLLTVGQRISWAMATF